MEYKDSLEKLDDTGLPPKEVFFSRLQGLFREAR